MLELYRGADKFLARPGRKQVRKHIRDARDFNNIETRAVIKFFFFFLQGKEPKEFDTILTEILACFPPGRAKDLSAPLYFRINQVAVLQSSSTACWMLSIIGHIVYLSLSSINTAFFYSFFLYPSRSDATQFVQLSVCIPFFSNEQKHISSSSVM